MATNKLNLAEFDCAMCKNSSKEGARLVKCGHTFCQACVKVYAARKQQCCPECSAPFTKSDIMRITTFESLSMQDDKKKPEKANKPNKKPPGESAPKPNKKPPGESAPKPSPVKESIATSSSNNKSNSSSMKTVTTTTTTTTTTLVEERCSASEKKSAEKVNKKPIEKKQPEVKKEVSKVLLVENIGEDADNKDLLSTFRIYGKLHKWYLLDKENATLKFNKGLVFFLDSTEAATAQQATNGKLYIRSGKPLKSGRKLLATTHEMLENHQNESHLIQKDLLLTSRRFTKK